MDSQTGSDVLIDIESSAERSDKEVQKSNSGTSSNAPNSV
jgi:hypothetical protein